MDQRLLRRLANEVDEAHRESMRTIEEDLAGELDAISRRPATSRRRLLQALTVGGAVVTVGATAIPLAGSAAAETDPCALPGVLSSADGLVASFANGLELAAVAAYQAVINAQVLDDTAGPVAQAFMEHHRQHASAWAALGGRAVSGTANAKVLSLFADKLKSLSSQDDALSLAFDLENAAAGTYAALVGEFGAASGIDTAAKIGPIESAHAVVLGQVLNRPLADYAIAFEDTDKALDPKTYAAG